MVPVFGVAYGAAFQEYRLEYGAGRNPQQWILIDRSQAAQARPPTPAPAAPFDVQRAKVQLGIAAFKASTCGSLGGARGAGDVTVIIESFGRVTRVTHTNPAFVGTPVGACVTQAYQQVQVAPFSGGPQTMTSSFVVP